MKPVTHARNPVILAEPYALCGRWLGHASGIDREAQSPDDANCAQCRRIAAVRATPKRRRRAA